VIIALIPLINCM